VTEIPEHLLKAAAAARARLAGESAEEPAAADTAAAPSAAAPAVKAAATPAVPEPEKAPEPVAPYVEAGLARKTMPVWIIPVLLFLPIWAIYYVGYLENPPAAQVGLHFEGQEIFGVSCAGCHGGGGGGGTGRQLNGGEVLLTFPSVEDGASYDGLAGQLHWVANGTAGSDPLGYGDPARPGGGHTPDSFNGAQMAGFGATLSTEQLIAVVYAERTDFGGFQNDGEAAELAVLEELVVVMGDEGAVFAGASLDEIQGWIDTARGLVTAG